MIENLPVYIALLFAVTTLATLLLFYIAVRQLAMAAIRKQAEWVLSGLTAWLIIQAAITLKGAYNTNTNAFPPRLLLLGIVPTLIIIIILFATRWGRRFIDGLPPARLTYLHIVRVPVEITLLLLAHSKAVPLLMTFEGRNFDILAGITAPFIAWYGFTKRRIGRWTLFIWNIACLLLLLNIVVNALLSTPLPLQQFAFDQPNIAILYFPFSWLPVFIVPVVLFCHLAILRQLAQRVK